MSAVDQVFADLRQRGEKALMPFVTAGDPSLPFTRRVLETLAASGASLCELGIPYSDPIADGPVIQASYTRALDQGIRLESILRMLAETTPTLAPPVITMVSYAIVYRHGIDAYIKAAQQAGAAGAIIPDLPVEEAASMVEQCRQADFSLIQLVTPTTPRDRAVRIAETSTGFLYYVSVAGITGERTSLPPDLAENVAWLKTRTPLPICIGFGISQPEHVQLLAPVADGLIVGSAIVRRIAQATTAGEDDALKDIAVFMAALKAAAA